TSWAKINAEERKRAEVSNQKPKLTGEFDPKGMIIGDKGQRQIDLRSLDANQLSRLARFFSHNRNEFSISDNDSIITLTKEINGALGINPLVNFDILMDIAEGKLRRKENTFAPYIAQQYFNEDDLVRDNSRKPNYDKLLQRNESLRDVELNKKRGITFSGKDYLNRKRTIELNYFTDTQMQKLQQFFATAKGDLQTPEGDVNREAVTSRINQLLNQTNLTYEDIADIAEGHLVRKSAHAPSDHFTVLIKDVERKGNAPSYDALVQQRTDYIAEQ
ncbi:MAG TPA: hypothetical protein PLD88_00145, partial [Candidatus Berkiella sp.]|nr:hypothetical protein [Candidatus Berkiella sp.]